MIAVTAQTNTSRIISPDQCIRHYIIGFWGAFRLEKSGEVSKPVENISRTGPQNRRSLGFARDDKGDGDISMESGCWTEGAFSDPQENRNSFVRRSLMLSRSLAAFSNSNFLAASRISDSSFPI